jgi:hypothetical protein
MDFASGRDVRKGRAFVQQQHKGRSLPETVGGIVLTDDLQRVLDKAVWEYRAINRCGTGHGANPFAELEGRGSNGERILHQSSRIANPTINCEMGH